MQKKEQRLVSFYVWAAPQCPQWRQKEKRLLGTRGYIFDYFAPVPISQRIDLITYTTTTYTGAPFGRTCAIKTGTKNDPVILR